MINAVEPPDAAQGKTTERGRRELLDTSRVSGSTGPARLSYASPLDLEAEQLDNLLEPEVIALAGFLAGYMPDP